MKETIESGSKSMLTKVGQKTGSSKNSKSWFEKPKLPETHFIETGVYTNPDIFNEEIEKIFNKVWLPICHESELPNKYDYRTTGVAGNKPLISVRGPDNKIRTFLNVCPHRGNTIMRNPAGNLLNAEPSGNPKNMTCMFHGWQFDAMGHCVDIPREKQGYQDRLCKADIGLREIRSEIAHGGFIWVNLDDNCESLSAFVGDAFDLMSTELDSEPLEIFHYQKSIIPTNYKLWHETSREFYHDYMHYHNRATGMLQKGYFDRKYSVFDNGHAATGLTTVTYDAYEGSKDRHLTFPGMPKNGWKQLNIFPSCTYSLRASCLRVSVMTPISEKETLIEIRGLGLKGDTPEQRQERIADHDTIWGPFGRNLMEDLLAVQNQTAAMGNGSNIKHLLMAREEDSTIHDEIGLRSYYAEWSKRMEKKASSL